MNAIAAGGAEKDTFLFLHPTGDINVWFSPAAIKAWNAKPSGKRGAPRKYSDIAIETALALRLVFHLPLR